MYEVINPQDGNELLEALFFEPSEIKGVLRLFRDNLPKKPYCANNLALGLLIRTMLQAVKFRYIQPNSPNNLGCLVFDIDRYAGDFDWYFHRAPAPNIVVQNPLNHHVHDIYLLKTPVHKQPGARYLPLRYAASIDVALSLLLDADPGYSGLICKNPLHKHWNVMVFKLEPYSLGELAVNLDLEPYRDRRRHLPAIGLGRNCALFDVTRRWAYRHIRLSGWDEAGFTEAVIGYADNYNTAKFPTPLPFAEVRATAKSIVKWTIQRMSEEGFKAWCSRRGTAGGLKSGAVRLAKSLDRAAEIKAFKAEHPDMSNRMIAKVFKYSLDTVNRALRNL